MGYHRCMRSWGWSWGAMLVAVCTAGACGTTVEVGTSQGGASAHGGGAPTTTAETSSATAGGTMGAGGAGCAIDCSSVGTPPCMHAVCVASQCVVTPKPHGSPCDDGAFCTTNDACQSGVCKGTPGNDCGLSATTSCEEVVCDEATDTCAVVPLMDGATCTPDDLCLQQPVCSGGICVGTPRECDGQGPLLCHAPVCDPMSGQCVPEPSDEGLPCILPNDFCIIDAICVMGTCQGSTPKTCPDPGPCQVATCMPSTGVCVPSVVPDGTSCDDLDACTTSESCTQGTCGSGVPITACLNGDGCCPNGCTSATDTDCSP